MPSGCVEYRGSRNNKGYGQLRCNRRMEKAYRVAYAHANGPIPPGAQVLHRCDNPACVNIDHLFLGTNRENIDDKCQKDRSGKKLKIADAIEIKRLLGTGVSQKEIAAMFNVAQGSISRINTGQRWVHARAGGY